MKSMNRFSGSLFIGTATLFSILLSGCSANFNGTSSSTGASTKQTGSLKGRVMGGQFPLTSARVYLYTAPSTGSAYGSAAVSDVISNGNTSNAFDGGAYYVTSDATTGGFDLTGDFTCGQNDQTYLLVRGGSPSTGAPQNQDSALMVALGACSTLNGTRNIVVNELTTVAAVYSLQQFMTDATHVSASSADAQGLANAFTTAQWLVDSANGVPSASTATVTLPTGKIYTLGEVLAHCVNSDPGSSSNCSDVFNAANTNVVTGTIGTTPTDTIQAVLEIARNTGANTNNIIALTGTGIVFGASNEITAANDFALPIAYLGPGLLQVSAVAIDADGNAYVNSCAKACDGGAASVPDVVAKITPAGMVTTFGSPTVHNPQGIMVDSDSFNVWNTDSPGDVGGATAVPAVDIFTRTGTLVAQATNQPAPASPFLALPEGIAYDPVNSVAYVADSGLGTLQQITQSGTAGTALTLTGGTSATSLVNPVGVAIDSNGDIVASDTDPSGGGYVVFVPAGAGTYTGTANKGVGVNLTAIAFDHTHHLWGVDTTANQVYSIDYTGTNGPGSYYLNNSAQIRGIAVDGGGQVLLPSCNSNACGTGGSGDALFLIDNSGSPTPANGAGTGAYGIQDPSLANPVSVAVDASGNVWVTSVNPGAVTMFVGLANPVQTPLASAVAAAKLGARP